MTTCQEMIDDLNDRLNDPTNTQIAEATKIRYLNHGIRGTWPRLYRTMRDASLLLLADQFEYLIPPSVGSNSKIIRVEYETHSGSGRYAPVYNFDVVPGLADPILQIEHSYLPAEAGARLRITAAKHLSDFTSPASVYDGPTGTEELPVLYGMGVALSRRLDDRVDYRRFVSVTNQNGVGTDEIMTASQFSFAQYELLLERFAMPLPSPDLGG